MKTKEEALIVKEALESLFKGKAYFVFWSSGQELEVTRPGWGYLLEYAPLTNEVFSNLSLVMNGHDEGDYTCCVNIFKEIAEELM